ncbi:hypothetical protein, partial [Klebsiella pneumoniae]|uniref:hypothetical protein n=1 Tax=Klebsiella pneumoniae TaxID=573 RepID=UPI002730F74B
MSDDNNKKYFISCFGSAGNTIGAYIYDYDSIVKLQTPKLFKKIVFPSSITYGNKTQGLTIIDEFIYLSQG